MDERSVNAVDKQIGRTLRARRLELGISQESLADSLGITFQQIQKYEKGINRISASRLFDAADVLRWPAGRFFEGLGTKAGFEQEPRSRVLEALATPEGIELATIYASIESPALRQKVLKLVQSIAEDSDFEGPSE